MPVAFLAPLFLAGLAAIAVPVILHLANRPRKRVVEFPSLMFLERVEYRASSRRSLRHVLLLALRVLALVLVAAAFARPFVDRPDAPAVAVDGGRELVVLLDRSASMGGEGGGEGGADRMARAREAVADAASSLGRGDRATLVVFDHDAAAAGRPTDRPAALVAAADTVRPGHGATRYAPALRLARSLLSASPLPRRELVLITDFQRTGWDPSSAPRMPAGTSIRLVPVGAPPAGAGITDVAVARERFSGRERVRLRARVVNRGADPFEAPVELVVSGRTLASEPVRVAAGGEAVVELGPLTLDDVPTAATVGAGRDALPMDNAYRLVLEPGRRFRVLLVEPPGGATPDYLARALEAGGAHEVGRVRADRFDAGQLAGIDVAVLNGVTPTASGAARALETFVGAGGGLVVVAGAGSRSALPEDGAALLPGVLGGTRDRGDDGAALASLRYEHPLLRPFRDAPAGLTAARFYRYREVDPAPGADVLARFDDGAPALVAGPETAGRGRVLLLASPLDGRWSDLVLQPAFVPLAHGLVRHAADRDPAPAALIVGDLLDAGALLSAGRGAGSPDTDGAVLLTPSGVRVPAPPGSIHRLREAGFYQLRDPAAGSAAPMVAVNPDPLEAMPETVDPEEVRAAIAGGEGAGPPLSFAPEDRERHQSLWWYVLLAAFLMMTAETALSNRLSRRALPVERRTG